MKNATTSGNNDNRDCGKNDDAADDAAGGAYYRGIPAVPALPTLPPRPASLRPMPPPPGGAVGGDDNAVFVVSGGAGVPGASDQAPLSLRGGLIDLHAAADGNAEMPAEPTLKKRRRKKKKAPVLDENNNNKDDNNNNISMGSSENGVVGGMNEAGIESK